MSPFTHLRTHSNYSLLRGLPAPVELVQAAAQCGMHSLALTDHRLLTGAIEFYSACKEAGIKPILGLELEVLPPTNLAKDTPGTLVFLAMDLQGWSNLCRLSSLTSDDNPRLTFEQVSLNTDGLICLTGGKRGLLESLQFTGQRRKSLGWLSRLGEIFPDRLYIELQNHTTDDAERHGKTIELNPQPKTASGCHS